MCRVDRVSDGYQPDGGFSCSRCNCRHPSSTGVHQDKSEPRRRSTMQMKVTVPASLPPDRKIEGAKLEFTLKRLGIFENSEVQILPTTPRCWLWHPYDWCPAGTSNRQCGRA